MPGQSEAEEALRTALQQVIGTYGIALVHADIPDFIVGLGYTDDLAVLAGAIKAVGAHITDEHRDRARATLRCLRQEA